MKKIILIITILITSLTYSQTVSIGSTTVNKGAKGDMPNFTINGTTVQDGTVINVSGSGGSINTLAITNLSELQAGTTNKIWSIQGNIDLGATTLNIPSGVILKFEGGLITNGTLNGDNTYVWSDELVQIFGLDVTFTGTWKYKSVLPEWFGGGADVAENRYAFRKAIEFVDVMNGGTIELFGSVYDFSSQKENTAWGVDYPSQSGKEGIIEVHNNTHIVSNVGSTLRVVDDGIDTFIIYPVRSFIGSPTFTIELNDDDRVNNPRQTVPRTIAGFEDEIYINNQYVGTLTATTNTQLTLDSFNGVTFNVGDIVTIRRYAQYRLIKFDDSKNSSLDGVILEGNREVFFHYGSKNAGEPSAINFYGSCDGVTVNNCEIKDFPADAFLNGREGNFEADVQEIWETGGINSTTGVNEVNANQIRSVITYSLTTPKILENNGFMMQDMGSYQQWNAVPRGKLHLYFYDVTDAFVTVRLNQNMYEWLDIPATATYLKVVIDATDDARFDYTATGGETTLELDRQRASLSGISSSMKTFVWVNDVFLDEGSDYTWTDGATTSTINWTTPLTASDVVLVSFQYYRVNAVAALIPKNINITNNKMHDLGRQGLSITGMQNGFIDNNICYNVYGSPGAFVDIEDGELYNRYITISNNIVWNCRLGIQLYATVGINIIGNRFLRSTDEEGGSTTTINQLVGQSHVGGSVTVKNNYFEQGLCYVAPEMIFESNVLEFSSVEMKGGRCINNRFYASSLNIYTEESNYIGQSYIYGNEFITNPVFPTIYSAGLSMDVLSDEQTPSYFINNTFIGDNGTNPAHFKKGLIVKDVSFNNTSSVLVTSGTVDGLKSTAPVQIYYIPEDNEHVVYKDWEIITDDNSSTLYAVRLRGNTTNLHHFEFKNLLIESTTFSATNFLLDIDKNLGSLTIRNSQFIDRTTTNTNWFVINFDQTIDKFRMINSEVIMNSAGNLLDKGTSTETASWLYKDNIFTNVVLNNTTGTEMNNLEE